MSLLLHYVPAVGYSLTLARLIVIVLVPTNIPLPAIQNYTVALVDLKQPLAYNESNYYHEKSRQINLTETKPARVPFNGRMDDQTRLCLWTFHTPALSLRLPLKNAKSGTLLTRKLWANTE